MPKLVGEKALFLIDIGEQGMFSSERSEKFSIDEDGYAINDYYTYVLKNYESKHLDELKIEIKEIARVQKEINEHLDSPSATNVLIKLETEFKNQNIPINGKTIRTLAYLDLKNKANQDMSLVVNFKQIKEAADNIWSKSRDNPSGENFRYAKIVVGSSTRVETIP